MISKSCEMMIEKGPKLLCDEQRGQGESLSTHFIHRLKTHLCAMTCSMIKSSERRKSNDSFPVFIQYNKPHFSRQALRGWSDIRLASLLE